MTDPDNGLQLYWSWLLGRNHKRAGILNFLNGWLALHGCVGVLLGFLVKMPVQDAANTVLLPLSGVFIGLCFAWAGNAQALLQTPELEQIGRHHPDGPESYAYFYQTAILVIMIALVAWGLAGLGVFTAITDRTWTRLVEVSLYGWSSLTLRECWHVVLGAQMKLLMRMKVRDEKNRASKPETAT